MSSNHFLVYHRSPNPGPASWSLTKIRRFLTSSYRRRLLYEAQRVLKPYMSRDDFEVWVLGSFVTEKEKPADIDLVILADPESETYYHQELGEYMMPQEEEEYSINIQIYPRTERGRRWLKDMVQVGKRKYGKAHEAVLILKGAEASESLENRIKRAMDRSMKTKREMGFEIFREDGELKAGELLEGASAHELKELPETKEKSVGLFHTHVVTPETDFELASGLSPHDMEIAEDRKYEIMYIAVIDPRMRRRRLLKFTPAPPSPRNAFTGWNDEIIRLSGS